ncbi:hypothetical protein, partial [Nocardioides sp. NPDC000441]
MRPNDPRLRAQLSVARRPLAVVVAAGVLGAVLLIAQTYAVTGLLISAIRDTGSVSGWALAVVAVFAGRAVVGVV